MAEIHPVAWLTIGIGIIAFSLLNDSLRVFVIPGVGFLIWGVAKMIRKDTPRAPKHTYNTKPRNAQEATPQTKRCYVCSAKNHPQANYCAHCGHKLT